MTSLSLGHAAVDLAQGAVPALLVFIVPELDLSYALAGAVVLVATFSSSIVQPLFGHWSDTRGAMWLLPGGVLLAGAGIALASIAPSYPLLLLAVLASGIGVAAFHPEGSKFANYVSGSRRASGMAVFSVGGNTGFAAGPALGSALVVALGLHGGLLLVLPGLLVATLLLAETRYLASFVPGRARAGQLRPSERDRPRAFVLLLAIIGLRSIAHYGLFTFVPLWEVDQGSGEGEATWMLSLFLGAGAIGTLVAGPVADRFGRRPVIAYSQLATAPFIVAYVVVGGVAGIAAIALAGALLISSFGVSSVLGQELMPSRIATAAGLSIGLAIGLGGIFAVSLGALADSLDLRTAVLASAIGPALGGLLALRLPEVRGARMVEPVPAATP
jgi:FSR family fosmidomycin resistance protein-like MFS transporter